MRVPRILVLPLLAIGGTVWAVKGIASVTASPQAMVFAGADEVTVEVLNGPKVESTTKVAPGTSAVVKLARGTRTVRSTTAAGAKHEVTAAFGLGDSYAVPTAADQCFAIVDIAGWYGYRGSKGSDARIEKRNTESAVITLPEQTYASVSATPTTIAKDDHPKMVTAYPCSKIASSRDADILAPLQRASSGGGGELPADMKADLATLARTSLKRAVADKHRDWTFAFEDEDMLAWKDAEGGFVVLDARLVPSALGKGGGGLLMKVIAVADTIDAPGARGVYRKADLVPSFDVPLADGYELMADRKVGYVLSPKGAREKLVLDRPALDALGVDARAVAATNIAERYTEAATDCVNRAATATTPVTCAQAKTEAAGVIALLPKVETVKGKPVPKIWLGYDGGALFAMKASKKPKDKDTFAKSDFVATLDAKRVAPGLK